MAHITVYSKTTGHVLRYVSVPDGEEEAQLANDDEAYQITGTIGNFALVGPVMPEKSDVEAA